VFKKIYDDGSLFIFMFILIIVIFFLIFILIFLKRQKVLSMHNIIKNRTTCETKQHAIFLQDPRYSYQKKGEQGGGKYMYIYIYI